MGRAAARGARVTVSSSRKIDSEVKVRIENLENSSPDLLRVLRPGCLCLKLLERDMIYRCSIVIKFPC